jgi:Chalcone isomerase-like
MTLRCFDRISLTPLRRALFAGLLLAASVASAARLAGQNFDDHIRLANTDLVLNGVGLRGVLMLKGYTAGLYLVSKARTPEQVLAVKGAKRVQMKMLIDVETKEFVKAFDVGMQRNNTEAEQAAMRERMVQFNREVALIGAVKKGDVIDLDFIPSRGLLLSLNGQPRGEAIAGEDLYAGLLKIFIGERPVDKKLKAGMLGLPVP